MNLRRTWAVFLQEVFLTTHSFEILVDVLIFPIINVIIFGLISLYLAGNNQGMAGAYVLTGMLLWQAVAITSYSVAVGAMWNIWSRNLSNMFVAPLRVKEYVLALFISGCIKAILLVAVGAAISAWLFHFNLLRIGGMNLTLSFVVFAIFGFALAIISLGLIFRFGTRIAALSWSMPWIFQPLSAAFFPLNALPYGFQVIARILPPTYAFEAAREGLQFHTTDWALFTIGLGIDLLWCSAAILLFRYLFERSRDTGQFARNES
jgi:ABC-2 type transport system permease protein